MQRFMLVLLLFCTLHQGFGQQTSQPLRPKLVVGLVIDQMRWDYLYRYSDRYKPDGGFKRLLKQGFSNENTLIPYTPTVTACGHTCIYTGSVPAIHGITGNTWYQRSAGKVRYCTEDKTVQTVGSSSASGQMSPRNLLVTTIGDELRLATNFRSKVIGIAMKDRGAILPAGHAANAAYWYDNLSGQWISSTYYQNSLPAWVSNFNSQKLVDQFYQQGWSTLYPLNTYVSSTADEKQYEGKPFGAAAKGFPYDLKAMIGKNYNTIAVTPFGNTMTLQLAKEAVIGEALGNNGVTDMLTVSLSSPDYIGHTFGPNSIEAEDGFLRLDADLGDFLNFLDQKVGKGQYLFFLSADHGVAHVPGFMAEHQLPGGLVDGSKILASVNAELGKSFGSAQLAISVQNNQVYLDRHLIDSLQLNYSLVTRKLIDYFMTVPGVQRAFATEQLSATTLPSKIREMVANGYLPDRSGDVQVILLPQYMETGPTGTTHGEWNPYDAHIPLVWYGWNIKPGKSNQEVYMTDIAPTIAALLHIQMPNGTIGKPIEAITR